VIVILGLFLIVPIFMAAWVSVSDWTGNGSPFGSNVHWVGLENYRHLLTTPGLDQSNFGTAMRNNALLRHLRRPDPDRGRALPGRPRDPGPEGVGFFRTAFYFPSVTSSVAITVLFLFLFDPQGAINKLLSYVGVTGPSWMYDPRGLFHVILGQFGVTQPPAALANGMFLGVSYWDWLSGRASPCACSS
jgi:multiple sugar transport system permease protein